MSVDSAPCYQWGLPPHQAHELGNTHHMQIHLHMHEGSPHSFCEAQGNPLHPQCLTPPISEPHEQSCREALILEGSHHDIQCHHIFICANRNVCLSIYINIHASCKPPSMEPFQHQWACEWPPMCSTGLHADSLGPIRWLQNQTTKKHTQTHFYQYCKKYKCW